MPTARFLVLITALLPAAAYARPDAARSGMPGEPIRPLPATSAFDAGRVALGKRLFFDLRFSRDGKLSCASCHDFAKGGADGRARPVGVDGRSGPLNVPSVFNAGFNFRQLWNGGAESLEEQLDMMIVDRNVFDSSWEAILRKLAQDAALLRDFKAVYADGLTRKNATEAIVLFERSLITPSRFDAYLRGDPNAISAEEKRGYARFKSYGCVACHQGVNIGGNMFQVFGVMRPYLKPDNAAAGSDWGRYLVTGRETDKYVFKVPSLRNVALTAPYFHNASAQTLEQAVDVMFKFQLNRTAPPEDKALIVKVLNSLSGELLPHARQEPIR